MIKIVVFLLKKIVEGGRNLSTKNSVKQKHLYCMPLSIVTKMGAYWQIQVQQLSKTEI